MSPCIRCVVGDVQNYLKSESTMSVTNELRALALDACSRLVYPLSQSPRTVGGASVMKTQVTSGILSYW